MSRENDNKQDSSASSSLSNLAINNSFTDDSLNFKEAEIYMRKHGKPPPRPPHLKGRDIGLWHSKMGRLKRSLEAKGTLKKIAKSVDFYVGNVNLSNSQKNELKTVLKNVPDHSNSYNKISDSQFKKDFLQNINGKLEDHIDHVMEYENDLHIDEILFDELQMKHGNQKFIHMLKKRNSLPSSRVKEKIINVINSSQVVLISGETGCGKTTQVPQFILDHFIENKKGSMCNIICTQPRRISAISVAERVAAERAENLGQSTGYQIRLEKKCPRRRGSLLFCTTGVVLRQMQTDPCLSEYTHIILDEIHERDIQTDFLITLLKQVISKRKDLRVILMSATLNAESFSVYFGNCPHLNIPGFTYHVEEYFLEDVIQRIKYKFEDTSKFNRKVSEKQIEFNRIIKPYIKKLQAQNKYDVEVQKQISNMKSEELNIRLIFDLLIDICSKEKDQGAVLIFLPGFTDISELHKLIKSSDYFSPDKFLTIPLHSQMPTSEQKEVFNTPPPGVRKIIISTSIAETSITIDDVVFVIDSGKIKVKNYDVESNTETLEPVWVSKANASQRKGRAGRVKPGTCFHLMNRARYESLESYMSPEILRTRLENVLLTAKVLQLGKIEDFFSKLMNSPDANTISTSLDLLKRLEALDENESLTPLGYHLAKLPMNPQVGKMLLFGALFNCLEPILNIAVTLDYKDAFLIPLGKVKESDWKRKQFAGSCKSDHLLMDKLLETFENLSESHRRKFCWEYFLSWQTMTQLIKLKKEFMRNLYDMNFVPNTNPKCDECNCNSHKVDIIRAVICAGLYPNVVKVRPKGRKRNVLYLLNHTRVKFHPKSVLNGQYLGNSLLVYYKMVKSSETFIHDATPIDPFHVIFFGDNFQTIFDGRKQYITISNSLKFCTIGSTSKLIKELRDKLDNILEYKISHPNVVDLRRDTEETVLFRTIIELLEKEVVQFEADSSENQDEEY